MGFFILKYQLECFINQTWWALHIYCIFFCPPKGACLLYCWETRISEWRHLREIWPDEIHDCSWNRTFIVLLDFATILVKYSYVFLMHQMFLKVCLLYVCYLFFVPEKEVNSFLIWFFRTTVGVNAQSHDETQQMSL